MKGVKNRATRNREAHPVKAPIAEQLTPEQIATLSAAQALERIMPARYSAGDHPGAKANWTATFMPRNIPPGRSSYVPLEAATLHPATHEKLEPVASSRAVEMW